ncbi:ADM_collapsed_G0040300.mRNA.1.CDS.1 [Saccharomyces cerevisiae]|nr:ADM_collapsed_G0040300.mRNA.1.CDS.1 [Saccharomyces cerevisiae]
MEMLLFLNESYIFIGFVCGVLFYGHSCVFGMRRMWECQCTGVPGCLEKPFSAPVKFPLSVKRISEF